MNIIESQEDIVVCSDLLHNSDRAENEFLDKIADNLNDLRIKENKGDISHTDASLNNAFMKYVRECTQLPEYNDSNQLPLTSFRVEQQWEGYVQEVNDNEDRFTALLLDMTANQKHPTEEADFPINVVDAFDRHFLCQGAVFRWVIGYERSKNGAWIGATKLSFRRLSKWNKQSLKKADQKAQLFKEKIIWE